MISDLKKLAKIPLKFDISFFLLLIFLPIAQFAMGGTILGLPTLAALPMLFLFVLLHEYGHCWAAHKLRFRVHSIKLWALGGLATLDERLIYATPKEEILIAIAGPAVNFIFGLLAWAISFFVGGNEFLQYIMAVNIILGVFNLIPAFPMDGGRIFRGIMHHFLWDKDRATKISAQVGVGFSIGFFILGITLSSFMLMIIFGWVGMICYSILRNENTIV
jgi:Zn-dependent protease